METLSNTSSKNETRKRKKLSLFQIYTAYRLVQSHIHINKGYTEDIFDELSLEQKRMQYVNAMIALRGYPKVGLVKALSLYKELEFVDPKKIYRMYWNELLDNWNLLSSEQKAMYGEPTMQEMKVRTILREKRRKIK